MPAGMLHYILVNFTLIYIHIKDKTSLFGISINFIGTDIHALAKLK